MNITAKDITMDELPPHQEDAEAMVAQQCRISTANIDDDRPQGNTMKIKKESDSELLQ